MGSGKQLIDANVIIFQLLDLWV